MALMPVNKPQRLGRLRRLPNGSDHAGRGGTPLWGWQHERHHQRRRAAVGPIGASNCRACWLHTISNAAFSSNACSGSRPRMAPPRVAAPGHWGVPHNLRCARQQKKASFEPCQHQIRRVRKNSGLTLRHVEHASVLVVTLGTLLDPVRGFATAIRSTSSA